MKRLILILMPVLAGAMLLPGCSGWTFARPSPEAEAQAGVDATNAAAIQAGVDAVNTAAQINNAAANQAAVPPPPINP